MRPNIWVSMISLLYHHPASEYVTRHKMAASASLFLSPSLGINKVEVEVKSYFRDDAQRNLLSSDLSELFHCFNINMCALRICSSWCVYSCMALRILISNVFASIIHFRQCDIMVFELELWFTASESPKLSVFENESFVMKFNIGVTLTLDNELVNLN